MVAASCTLPEHIRASTVDGMPRRAQFRQVPGAIVRALHATRARPSIFVPGNNEPMARIAQTEASGLCVALLSARQVILPQSAIDELFPVCAGRNAFTPSRTSLLGATPTQERGVSIDLEKRRSFVHHLHERWIFRPLMYRHLLL